MKKDVWYWCVMCFWKGGYIETFLNGHSKVSLHITQQEAVYIFIFFSNLYECTCMCLSMLYMYQNQYFF